MAFCDRRGNILAPFISAPGNRNESILLLPALNSLKEMAKSAGLKLASSIISLDGVYNSRKNRKAIFNAGMSPNIPENKRNRKGNKRGRKQLYDARIFAERFKTIERVFAWEDKFKRLLMRFERISGHHYSLKTIAYSMINLRQFCRY